MNDRNTRSINNALRGLAKSIGTSFAAIKKYEKLVAQKDCEPAIPKPVSGHSEQVQVDKRFDNQLELPSTPIGHQGDTMKRKTRTPPTPPTKEGELKKPKTRQVEESEPEPPIERWQKVEKKKKTYIKNMERSAGKRKTRTLPNALLISANKEKSYADILKKVKEGIPENEVEGAIEKVRRTASGQLLMVLNRKIGDRLGPLYSKMSEVLREEAKVTCKMKEVDLEIRDIEETTTAEEVHAALVKASDGSPSITAESVKSLRVAYGQTKIASVRLPAETAQKLIGERGKIRIGLVNCSIREVNKPRKCYKCWHVGHIASQCKSDVDRAKLCIKCGSEGHKAAQCINAAKCVLCLEQGKQDNCDHPAGSYKCTVVKEETQKTKNRR